MWKNRHEARKFPFYPCIFSKLPPNCSTKEAIEQRSAIQNEPIDMCKTKMQERGGPLRRQSYHNQYLSVETLIFQIKTSFSQWAPRWHRLASID